MASGVASMTNRPSAASSSSHPHDHASSASQDRRLMVISIELSNIQVDYRWGAGNLDRVHLFAKELVQLTPQTSRTSQK
jgi:hypothetical protein